MRRTKNKMHAFAGGWPYYTAVLFHLIIVAMTQSHTKLLVMTIAMSFIYCLSFQTADVLKPSEGR